MTAEVLLRVGRQILSEPAENRLHAIDKVLQGLDDVARYPLSVNESYLRENAGVHGHIRGRFPEGPAVHYCIFFQRAPVRGICSEAIVDPAILHHGGGYRRWMMWSLRCLSMLLRWLISPMPCRRRSNSAFPRS